MILYNSSWTKNWNELTKSLKMKKMFLTWKTKSFVLLTTIVCFIDNINFRVVIYDIKTFCSIASKTKIEIVSRLISKKKNSKFTKSSIKNELTKTFMTSLKISIDICWKWKKFLTISKLNITNYVKTWRIDFRKNDFSFSIDD